MRAEGLRDSVPVEPALKTGDQIWGKVLHRNAYSTTVACSIPGGRL